MAISTETWKKNSASAAYDRAQSKAEGVAAKTLSKFGALPVPFGWQVSCYDTSQRAVARGTCTLTTANKTEFCNAEERLTLRTLFGEFLRPDGVTVGVELIVKVHFTMFEHTHPLNIRVTESFHVYTRGLLPDHSRLSDEVPDKESVILALLAMGADHV